MKKILLAFPIVALLAAGCNTTQKMSSIPSPASQTPVTESINLVTTTTQTSSQENVWKIYKNSIFGFSFNYPSQDVIRGSDSDFQVASSPDDQNSLVNFHAEQTDKNLAQIIQEQKTNFGLTEPHQIALNGNKAYEGVGTGMINYYSIFIKNNTDLINITFDTGKDGLINNKSSLTNIQKQILDSFAFTK